MERRDNSRHQWERDYVDALLETDDAKLGERLTKAEESIYARVDVLEIDEAAEERLLISSALFGLDMLRRDLTIRTAAASVSNSWNNLRPAG